MNLYLISAFENTPLDGTYTTRFMGIADEALKRKFKVTYFNCTFRHSLKKQRFEKTTTVRQNENYELVFIHTNTYKKNVSLKRLWSHKRFTENLIKEIKKREKPDVIIISFPPISSAEKIAAWGKKNNIPVILDIIDPWPVSFLNVFPGFLKSSGKVLLSPMYKSAKLAFDNASGIFAISRQYIDWSNSLSKKDRLSKVFYPSVYFSEVTEKLKEVTPCEKQIPRPFSVVYAGAMGDSYDILTILKAAEQLENKHPGKFLFHFAGTGPKAKLVEEYSLKIPSVKFHGRLNFTDMMKLYSICDVGLIQHTTDATQSVTYKLFTYLAVGLPILNSLKSEMWDIIADKKVGLNNEPGDYLSLAENIEKLMNDNELLVSYRNNGLEFTKKEGDSDTVYKNYILTVEKIMKLQLENSPSS